MISPGLNPPLKIISKQNSLIKTPCDNYFASFSWSHLYAGDPMMTFQTNTPLLTSTGTVWLRCLNSVRMSSVRVNIVIPRIDCREGKKKKLKTKLNELKKSEKSEEKKN